MYVLAVYVLAVYVQGVYRVCDYYARISKHRVCVLGVYMVCVCVCVVITLIIVITTVMMSYWMY